MPTTRPTTHAGAIAVAAAALTFCGGARAVVVQGLDPLPRPAEGYVAGFNGSTCVAVGPRWFLTAKHIGGAPGGSVWMRGEWYTIVDVRPNPTYDLQLLQVDRDLPGFHRLAGDVGAGDPCLLAGFGVTGGAPLPNDGGYDWNGPRQETWGANVVEGAGSLLMVRFDPPSSAAAVPREAIFAVNDSGGGLFVWESDGSLRLAGIAVSVTNFGSAPYYAAAYALSVDLAKGWMLPIVNPSEPVSSGVVAPRAGVGAGGLPPWAGGAALVCTLATFRRRRR